MENSDDEYERPHVIIDNGSSYMKCGLSGEEGPRAVIRSCVGYPKKYSGFGGIKKNFYIGEDIKSKEGLLNYNYPINHGIIENWDEMERIWGHLFTNELRCAPEEHNIFLIDSNYSKENREKMAEIIFETYYMKGLYISDAGSLQMTSFGKENGIAVDLGGGLISFNPIIDGRAIKECSINYNFGGNELTEFLFLLHKKIDLYKLLIGKLEKKYNNILTEVDGPIIEKMKEDICYCALDFEKELNEEKNLDYELPDGNKVLTKKEKFIIPEALFNPILIGRKENSIAQGCLDSIELCGSNLGLSMKKYLYENIVLSGGTSNFKGLKERFEKEIKALVPEKIKNQININISGYGKYDAWAGGSIITSISTFKSKWVTRKEYKEHGSNIIHEKCP